jgi:hypothetical protein
MTIFVDEPQPEKNWCHMATDGDLSELHAMARKIGLRWSWFQRHPKVPHYDLSPGKRQAALRHGAIAIPAKELFKRCNVAANGD